MLAIGNRPVRRVDSWNQLVNVYVFKRAEGGSQLLQGIRFGDAAVLRRIASIHHHNHRLRPAGGQLVVEYEWRLALARPAGFVFAATVLKVENGVSALWILIISRWRVDHCV